MNVRYTPQALDELVAILAYIADRSRHGAQRVQRRLQAKTKLLSEHPFAGPMTEFPGLRRIFANPYPYALYYRIDGGDIVIVAVRHTASNIGSLPPG